MVPAQCRTDINLVSSKPHYGLARFVTPWSQDVSWTLLGRPGDNVSSLTARLQTAKPVNVTTELPRLDLYLDPACQYTVKMYPSIVSMMGQMVRLVLLIG